MAHWGSIAYIGGRIAYTALYISGIPFIRSLFWNIAAFGMLAVRRRLSCRAKRRWHRLGPRLRRHG
nr:MAPEG family protein [Bradyrhizobium sp. sGM-13]